MRRSQLQWKRKGVWSTARQSAQRSVLSVMLGADALVLQDVVLRAPCRAALYCCTLPLANTICRSSTASTSAMRGRLCGSDEMHLLRRAHHRGRQQTPSRHQLFTHDDGRCPARPAAHGVSSARPPLHPPLRLPPLPPGQGLPWVAPMVTRAPWRSVFLGALPRRRPRPAMREPHARRIACTHAPHHELVHLWRRASALGKGGEERVALERAVRARDEGLRLRQDLPARASPPARTCTASAQAGDGRTPTAGASLQHSHVDAPHDDAKGEDVGRRRRAPVVHHLRQRTPPVRFERYERFALRMQTNPHLWRHVERRASSKARDVRGLAVQPVGEAKVLHAQSRIGRFGDRCRGALSKRAACRSREAHCIGRAPRACQHAPPA